VLSTALSLLSTLARELYARESCLLSRERERCLFALARNLASQEAGPRKLIFSHLLRVGKLAPFHHTRDPMDVLSAFRGLLITSGYRLRPHKNFIKGFDR